MYDSLKITPKTRGYPIIFNHTNFHLYHYAGNNPIMYTDPDGRIYKNPFEMTFVKQVLGTKGVVTYYSTDYRPWAGKDGRAGSFVWGIIYLNKQTYDNPIFYDKNTFIHELYHQIQYSEDITAQFKLIKEFFLNEQMSKYGSIIGYEGGEPANNFIGITPLKPVFDGIKINSFVYTYDNDLTKYNTLKDLPFYEAQAQFVGDYAELYFDARYKSLGPTRTLSQKIKVNIQKFQLKQMARIMRNSGYDKTEAVRWIENDMK